MNKQLVINTTGKILLLEAAFMALPVLIAIFYRENINIINSYSFSMTIIISAALPMLMTRPVDKTFSIKDGYLTVALTWLSLSFFGALPYYTSGLLSSFVDSIFESVSGFTSSGASVLVDAAIFPNSMHFWRSFTQFIGGMGVIVFALAFMGQDTKGAMNIMRAEVPGPDEGKVVSKVGPTAKILYIAYVSLTGVIIIALILAGMQPFDAAIHGMGVTSTGGFSNKNLSIAHFNNPAVDLIISLGMFLSGVNFNIYYLILINRASQVLKSEEFAFYCKTSLAAIGLIFLINFRPGIGAWGHLKDVAFTVISTITTTGYLVTDYTDWPLASHIVLVVLFFTGGCSGSTAGGLKMSRVLSLIKSGARGVKKAVNPRRVLTITDTNKYVSDEKLESTQSYLAIYAMTFLLVLFLVSLRVEDFDTSFSMTLSAINNNSPSFAKVGPNETYAVYDKFTKLVLSLAMIVGRLEILPVLMLVMPSTYERS